MLSGSEPVFPVSSTPNTGLTLRQWFASMSLQGLIARGLEVNADRVFSQSEKEHEMARRAWQMADAMLLVEREMETAKESAKRPARPAAAEVTAKPASSSGSGAASTSTAASTPRPSLQTK